MNAVTKGKLGKLLLNKKTPVDCSQPIPPTDLADAIKADEVKHEECSRIRQPRDERDPGSDSEASSVGDHLVDPDTINLDETFFSPTYKDQCTIAKDCTDVRWQEGEGVPSADSDSEEPTGEDDRMYQIFSQISDYHRMVQQANLCSESFERRKQDVHQSQETLMNDHEVAFLLTQTECVPETPRPGNDPNWECVVAEPTVQTGDDMEIFVSTSAPLKPKRVLGQAEQLKRQEWEATKKLFLATHKTHLLLLLAHGIRINRIVNYNMVEHASELYELIANSELLATEQVSLEFVKSVLVFYKTVMKLAPGGPRGPNQSNAFVRQLISREVTSRKMLNLILLSLLRFLSVRARLVMSLDVLAKYPTPVKSTTKVKCQNPPTIGVNGGGTQRYGDVPLTTMEILKRKPEIQKMFQLSQLDGPDDELTLSKKMRIEPRLSKPQFSKLKTSTIVDGKELKHSQNVENSSYFSKKAALNQTSIEKTIQETLKASKLPTKRTELTDKTLGEVEEKRLKLISCKYFSKKPKLEPESKPHNNHSTISDKPNLAKLLRNKREQCSGGKPNREETKHRIPKLETWIECYLEQEQRWIVVEAELGQTDCLDLIIDQILAPPAYVFAWEMDGTIVDVSPRYRWRNEQLALRQRVDDKWLLKALARYRFRGVDDARLREVLEFRQLKLRAPVPNTIAQCKNHPSYCLRRHLQKFQAIYPPDAPPLGFVQGEPLYARECVHTLHSREVWLRHAKVIRLLEQPYKIVRTKLKRQPADLELFGVWQTEEYVPPEPVNGIVPRNAYGNIEIFKDCMLPKGTVHLKQYGLSYICRKLAIDYAVAVVGFGVHAGGNHPIFDGIVICAENRDRLLAAWQRHQDEAAQKKVEKQKIKVLNNWVKLVKGLLVRKKLKHKYNFEGW